VDQVLEFNSSRLNPGWHPICQTHLHLPKDHLRQVEISNLLPPLIPAPPTRCLMTPLSLSLSISDGIRHVESKTKHSYFNRRRGERPDLIAFLVECTPGSILKKRRKRARPRWMLHRFARFLLFSLLDFRRVEPSRSTDQPASQPASHPA